MKGIRHHSAIIILVIVCLALFSYQGFAVGSQSATDYEKTTAVPSIAILLLNETIYDVIKDVDLYDYATEAEIVTDEYGRPIALTKLMIVFKLNTTRSQFEKLLDSLSAIITISVAGTRSVVVRIPQPTDLAAYYTLIEEIEAEPFVDFVLDGEIAQLAGLPSNYQSDPVDLNELLHIDNHLAIRAHAAWNASRAIDSGYQPDVIVGDTFGGGPPIYDTINCVLSPAQFRTTGIESNGHGYAVLGVIAGSHGNFNSTGIYPGTIRLGVLDRPIGIADEGSELLRLLSHLRRTTGRIILNTSFSANCNGIGGYCTDIASARRIASLWIEDVRRFNLEGRILHLTTASNILPIPGYTGPDIRDAGTASIFNSAALLSGLTDTSGNSLQNLTNTLVIENAGNWYPEVDEPATTKCLMGDSFVGGHLAGIGDEVTSFVNPGGGEGPWYGTSVSTPQVAGLAAFIWSIDHSLTPQQVIGLLTATSDAVPVIDLPGCSNWSAPAPIVDAYEALLALDAADTPTVTNSPVRFAVLDVNEDGSFDENDLQLLVQKYYDTSGADPVLIDPFTPDYGRLDLNGDGWTGGSSIVVFDLDRTGSTQYGRPNITNSVTQDVEGTAVSFDENTVRDSDILCYYAYSNLYSGGNIERQVLLEGVCHVINDEVCLYDNTAGWYWRECLDTTTGIATRYEHSFPPNSTLYDYISVEIIPEDLGTSVKSTGWAKMLDQTPAHCDVGKPGGWFVLDSQTAYDQREIFNLDGFNYYFPAYYSMGSQTFCWPDRSHQTGECGEYACPGIETLQPSLPYPGDCHQWWDHYDEQGNWVECDYP